jgi:hypothetical protein
MSLIAYYRDIYPISYVARDLDRAMDFAHGNEGVPQVRFAYLDTRSWLGHYTEYLWWAQGMAAANAALPDLAK